AVLLLAGGYVLYEKVLKKPPVRAWDLVPAATVFVYEKDACSACINEMQGGALWEIISQASFYGRTADSLKTKLTALAGQTGNLLVSAHVTGKDGFDFVYYLAGARNAVASLSDFHGLKGYRYSERELNKVSIHELSSSKQTFSWI